MTWLNTFTASGKAQLLVEVNCRVSVGVTLSLVTYYIVTCYKLHCHLSHVTLSIVTRYMLQRLLHCHLLHVILFHHGTSMSGIPIIDRGYSVQKEPKKSVGRINEGLACSEPLNMVTKTTPDEIDR